MTTRYVLGLSASHNGSACLLAEDRIRIAVSEERLSRRKRQRIYGADEALCIRYCLDGAGISADQLDHIVVAPQKKGHRKLHDLGLNPVLRVLASGTSTERISHHYGHAVSTFATSGFDQAAVLVVDGIGSALSDMTAAERAATVKERPDGHEVISIYRAAGNQVTALRKQVVESEGWLSREAWQGRARRQMPSFGSLGGMFSAVAVQLFGDADAAGKVMGLAAYGKPVIPVSDFLSVDGDEIVFHDTVPQSFAGKGLWPAHERAHRDLAASVQAALEESMLHLADQARALTGLDRLCIAGGVALNGLANQRIMAELPFTDLYVIPASDDSGVAIGAAYHGAWTIGVPVMPRRLRSDALGVTYSSARIDQAISGTPAVAVSPRRTGSSVVDETADLLASGRIVGWFQGGSELGPRALGQRSILCDPRAPTAKDQLNLRVKHREAFRPFAASVLDAEVENWFDLAGTSADSPHMLRVIPVRPERRDSIPAVVHPDGTCRIQSVSRLEHPRYHALISAFRERTGVPLVLNTSLNVMGEPIAETPEDALWTLLYTQLDYCVVGDVIVSRAQGYSSALELVPRVRDGVMIRSQRRADGAGEETVSAVAQTPWGPLVTSLDPRAHRILTAVDGWATAAEIWKSLQTEDTSMAEPDFLRALAALRSGSVVDFSWAPSGRGRRSLPGHSEPRPR